jgi:hypothetical protein
MLGIFNVLDAGQNPTMEIAQFGSYIADYPSLPTSVPLSDVLAARPVTVVVFVDIVADGATTGDSWLTVLSGGLAPLYSRPDVTVVAVLGRLSANVSIDDFPSLPANPLVFSNGAWSGSFGSIFSGAFDSPPIVSGNTPFVYIFARKGVIPPYQYRICDKFHMGSADTGDRDGRPAGSAGSKDLLSFSIAGSTPSFSQLPAFILRRVDDIASALSLAHPVAAITTALGAPIDAASPLDLDVALRVAFDRKLVGPGLAANFSKTFSASAPTPLMPAEFAYNDGLGQTAIDSYLSDGEAVRIIPDAATLASHAGGTLSLYATENPSTPGTATVTDTAGEPYRSAVPATPLLLGFVPVGAPRLYVRTNVSDDGTHGGGLSNSPDIAVFHDPAQTEVALRTQLENPLFETVTNDIWESGSLNSSRCNRLFVRSFNSGTMKTHGLRSVLYYAEPGTLSFPNDWHPVCNSGTVPHEFFSGTEIPARSGANPSLAVSGMFDWNANLPAFDGTTPSLNHHCFISLTASDNDWIYPDTAGPIPTLDELNGKIDDYDQFRSLVMRKNVAWKNFMTIKYTAKASDNSSGSPVPEPDFDFGKKVHPVWVGKDRLRIPVKLPVSRRKEFVQLEIENGLPQNARLEMLAHRDFIMKDIRALRSTNWKVKGTHASLGDFGARPTRIPDFVAGANAPTGVVLDFNFPQLMRVGSYRVDIVQNFRGIELGRLTIIIQKPRQLPFIRRDARIKELRVRDIRTGKIR